MTEARILVAVGLVVNQGGQVLMAQRQPHQHQALSWEFPGGKVEPDETVEQALKRELFEEVGIVVKGHQFMTEISHDYPDKKVLLCVHKVFDFEGQAQSRESQPIRWVNIPDLIHYQVPVANRAIVQQLISFSE